MTAEDGFLLFVQIGANGIIVYFLQQILAQKIQRNTKRKTVEDEVIILFWEKLQELNTHTAL